jgi:hypothetical protein
VKSAVLKFNKYTICNRCVTDVSFGDNNFWDFFAAREHMSRVSLLADFASIINLNASKQSNAFEQFRDHA